MKSVLLPVLMICASVAWSQIDYQPISGALLEHWNTAYSCDFPKVYNYDSGNLPEDIYELRIAGIEVERDSLDIYLLGIASDTDIPFLLATGGYRGEYNFTKSGASYNEEEDQICLSFQMPFSARYCEGCYRWNFEDESLELTQYISGDPSLDAMEKADSLMAEGDIAEAIDELSDMFYPGNYYSSDEMIARLLRSINRAAGEAEAEDNFEKAVDLFGDLAGFLHTEREWFSAFTDSLDYVSCDYSEYMGLGEYAMVMNNYAYFLERTGDFDKSLVVLRKVLDLKPQRMVAHLNIADVLWELAEPAEAGEHYRIYVEMMTDRELTHQIPNYVLERLFHLPAVSVAGIEAVEVSTSPVEGMEFAHIPSGSFLMGSPSSEIGHINDEGPQHRVEITAFELMTTEVTQGMWLEVMGTDLRYYRDLGNPEWYLKGEGYYYPMYFISHDDCQRFAAAMNAMDSDYIYRLPSEAEWEYACRAGTNTAYYWGDSSSNAVISRYCWYEGNSDETSHPVAQKEPNQWGLYDMSGNLQEWCEDSYHNSYSGAPSNGDAWFSKGDSLRIDRCGSWSFSALHCRSAERNYTVPANRFNNVGLRLARVLRTPEMVVKISIDAYNNANGHLLMVCSPAGQLEELQSLLALFEEYPDLAVATFAEMGADITAEKVEYMVAGDFLSAYLRFDTELPNFSSVEVEMGDAIINGETAIVPITVDGNVEEMELFIEDGRWKLLNALDGTLQEDAGE
jgi:formylglycine-generating enzyme required for sulfatase activity